MKIAFAAFLLAYPVFAAGLEQRKIQDVLELGEVVALAVKNNPALLSAEQDIIIAKQRVREARFMNLPQMALSGTLSKVNLEYPMILGPELGDRYLDPAIQENFYTLRAYALQPLYTGGKNKNTLRMTKTAHNQAKVNYDTVRNDVVYGSKKAFYTLLRNKKLQEMALETLDQARLIAGKAGQDAWQAIEAKAVVAGLERQTAAAEHDMEAARMELVKTLNREPSYQVDVSGELSATPSEISLQKSLVTGMEMRSELKSELYKAQMDDIAVNMALVRRYPNIYLGASYDVIGYKVSSLADNSVRSNNWTASIAIHFPLSYDIWTQVQQKRAQQRQGDLKRVELQDKVRFEILNAYKDLEFWAVETAKRKTALDALQKAYSEAAARAPASLASLRALCSVCELKKSYFEGVYQQLMARIQLEWAQGRDIQ